MEYGPDGQLLNASFMDFLMPYASEVPEIEIDHLETPSPLNPLGVKGAGEAGVIPGSAAIASAIEDADGIPIRSMPISPSELFDLRSRRSVDGLRPGSCQRTGAVGILAIEAHRARVLCQAITSVAGVVEAPQRFQFRPPCRHRARGVARSTTRACWCRPSPAPAARGRSASTPTR
jgi:hypothetical protein